MPEIVKFIPKEKRQTYREALTEHLECISEENGNKEVDTLLILGLTDISMILYILSECSYLDVIGMLELAKIKVGTMRRHN